MVVGTPDECAEGVRALAAAGADAIPLCGPYPKPPAEDIERLGRDLLPLLRQPGIAPARGPSDRRTRTPRGPRKELSMAHVTPRRPALVCALSCAGLLAWLAPSTAAAATAGTAKLDSSGKVVYTATLGVENRPDSVGGRRDEQLPLRRRRGHIAVQGRARAVRRLGDLPAALGHRAEGRRDRPAQRRRHGEPVGAGNTITRIWLGNGDDT